jgi:hypothetical protein
VTPSEIIAALAADSSRRDEAARALLPLLERIAAAPIVEPTTRGVYRIRENDRPDIVHDVWLKVVDRGPLPIVGAPDEVCVAYLKTMLVRHYISQIRRAGPSITAEHAARDRAGPVGDDDPDARRVLDKSRQTIDRMVGVLIRNSGDANGAALREVWQQVSELVYGTADMEDILRKDEGLDETATPRDWKRARDRVQQRHKRFRDRLTSSISEMERAGELSPADAAIARHTCTHLLRRRQIRGAGGVSTGGAPPSGGIP